MNDQEVSAFAAFSQKKAKILERKLKQKKKGKPKQGVIGSAQKAAKNANKQNALQRRKKKIKKNQGDNKDLINSILEAQKQSIFNTCAIVTTMNNMFLSDKSPELQGVSQKKLKKSMEDLTNRKTKKIKLMNGLNTKNSEIMKSGHKNVGNKVNGGVDGGGGGENCRPKQQKSSEGTRNSLNNMNKPKKKKKIMNNKCTKNIDVNTKMKNTDSKTLIQKNKKETESSLVKGKTDSFKLNGQSGLSKEFGNTSALPQSIYTDCVKVGEEVFSWMLSPLSVKDFFKDCWEQKPLHIQHNDKNYFKDICTLDDFKKALREHDMYFTRNIDVTSYIDGERHTENPEGKAKPSQVWDFYKNGRSIRLLNPQTFIQNVRVLNSTLQEFFHCFVGANIYLTPPGTQGFAPHYDDIEAFVLQLEGEKHWRLYNPRSPEEVLPRESSRNFKEDEIGEPVLEVILQPGDLLYFPRGFIHQAKCLPHAHSLHITVSCYQKNSWADLMEKVIPVGVQKAINEDVEFRKGLPLGYLNRLGLVHSEQISDQRKELVKKFETLVQKIIDYCPLDAGVDQLAVGYLQDALPPCLSKVEELHGADRNCKTGDENFLEALRNSSQKNLRVKLIRPNCVRLVAEEEELCLYYTTDNSLVYHEYEASSVRISPEWAQALEHLIHSYPNFVEMRTLPVSLKIDKPGAAFGDDDSGCKDGEFSYIFDTNQDGYQHPVPASLTSHSLNNPTELLLCFHKLRPANMLPNQSSVATENHESVCSLIPSFCISFVISTKSVYHPRGEDGQVYARVAHQWLNHPLSETSSLALPCMVPEENSGESSLTVYVIVSDLYTEGSLESPPVQKNYFSMRGAFKDYKKEEEET